MDVNGKQCYLCFNELCLQETFVKNYAYNVCDPKVCFQIFFSIVKGSGIRATAKLLEIAKGTVTSLKSIEESLWSVNYDCINNHKNSIIGVDIVPVDEAEMDGMWSFVYDKSQQYWVWWAIDHKQANRLLSILGHEGCAYA
jgi:hypothetical protein